MTCQHHLQIVAYMKILKMSVVSTGREQRHLDLIYVFHSEALWKTSFCDPVSCAHFQFLHEYAPVLAGTWIPTRWYANVDMCMRFTLTRTNPTGVSLYAPRSQLPP